MNQTLSIDQSPDDQRVFKWSLILGLSNEGRALARYPMLDLVCPLEAAPDTRYGLDGNGREGLSRRPTVGAVKDKKVRALYVGDAGTVIHPGTDLDIAKTVSLEGIAYRDRPWSFKPATLNLRYRISAENFPVTEHELALGYAGLRKRRATNGPERFAQFDSTSDRGVDGDSESLA